MVCDDLERWDGGAGREAEEGGNKYIYIQVIHLVVQQKLYNIIKWFYSNDKKIERFAKKKKKKKHCNGN